MHVLFFLVIFGITGTNAAIHSLRYMYTATSGIPDFPEFITVGMLDEQHFVYYDSKIKKMTSRQQWINKLVDSNYWESETQISKDYEQLYKINIQIAKNRFNNTEGVHTYQKMYGCEWDDETGETTGDLKEGYDGEDFLYLDLKELTWVSQVQQGFKTKNKWNNDISLLETDKQYFNKDCTEWLKKYLEYGRDSLKRTVSPQVSLLQKDSSSPVACHATGFYPSGVKFTWMRNGQEHEEDVDLGEILPNEDGTFQRTSTLRVKPDELKQFSCVVEHQGKTITENEIRTNYPSAPLGIIIGVIVGVALLLLIVGVVGYKVYQKKGKSGFVPANSSDGDSDSARA